MGPAQTFNAISGVIVLVLLIVGGYLLYDLGGDHERDRIEEENEQAGDAANETGDSFDDCVASGGVWVFETGKCRRP